MNKVILVDDDPVVNFIHTKLISSIYDCQIGAYTEAKSALEHLKTPEGSDELMPCLLLLDINMPVMNGWSFLAEFEKLPFGGNGQCKVFILTSSVDRDDETKSRQFKSVQGFLSKPLSKEKLRELMNGL